MTATLEHSNSLVPAKPQAKRIEDGRLFLKVKIKSLAAEARIIRAMEKKGGFHRRNLYAHRKWTVRPEARTTQIAYGFIRGLAYRQIEEAHEQPDWNKVEAMVMKYGAPYNLGHSYWPSKVTEEYKARFQIWRENATEFVSMKKILENHTQTQ